MRDPPLKHNDSLTVTAPLPALQGKLGTRIPWVQLVPPSTTPPNVKGEPRGGSIEGGTNGTHNSRVWHLGLGFRDI